jgi:hypothetical protein
VVHSSPHPDEAEAFNELPGDTVIVRGGHMGTRSLVVSACRCFDKSGYFAWSFWSRPGASADEIAVDAGVPHPYIRESTIGRVRDAGFDPQSDSADTDHVQVRLDNEPTEQDCARLRAAFDQARPREEPELDNAD